MKENSVFESFSSFVLFLYQPVDSSSLGVVRALFGLMMVFDVPHERGLHDLEARYGDPLNCHFPLFHWWSPLPFEYMGLVYFIMWIGALGICIGYGYKTSCLLFSITYWYTFLMDKTAWNNHSYLYGLLSLLFLFSSAHNSFSLDAALSQGIIGKPVPRWNYWIIRFQFFLLYFYAGLKKMVPDWLGGHSMLNLNTHWVFDPFRIFLTGEQIDLWIIHVFGFLFDLTVGFFLLLEKTRPFAIIFASIFHLMNSQMFHIGQFPYVCLVSTPIFCSYVWPKKMGRWFSNGLEPNPDEKTENDTPRLGKATWKQKMVVQVMAGYISLQLFLPYSHGFTKGYNNWTNGLYGYSWDMMVHSWDTTLITVTIVDHDNGKQYFLNPETWVRNTRYSKHADMMIQYASCIKRNLATLSQKRGLQGLQNISIYMDVWCSLNHRFQQRVFDPRQDLLKADWHPLQKTVWGLPLLSELTSWRVYIGAMHSQVFGWSNQSDALFLADFPGLEMEHYVRDELDNVTLTVLRGAIEVRHGRYIHSLVRGESLRISSGRFHTVFTISENPSCFVYTYINGTSDSSKPEDAACEKYRCHLV